jgi:hypothetical protein
MRKANERLHFAHNSVPLIQKLPPRHKHTSRFCKHFFLNSINLLFELQLVAMQYLSSLLSPLVVSVSNFI